MTFPRLAPRIRSVLVSLVLAPVAVVAQGSPGDVLAFADISEGAGFSGDLDVADTFGRSLALIGDLDGNGVEELAVGAPLDDDGGPEAGAVWILFRDADGQITSHQKIGPANGLGTTLGVNANFGFALAALGDRTGDGLLEIAVGAPNDGPATEGSVILVQLTAAGTVDSDLRLASGGNSFGSSVASLPDVDGDGHTDLAVGAPGGGGEVHLLRVGPFGGILATSVIGAGLGGFTGTLAPDARFGQALVSMDVTLDGTHELIVGAPQQSIGGTVFILSITSQATVSSFVAIDNSQPGLDLEVDDDFGSALAVVPDLDGDGAPDLAVGAMGDGSVQATSVDGAVWFLFLDAGGQVTGTARINETDGNFAGALTANDAFGSALAARPLGESTCPGLFVGAILADGPGSPNVGAFFDLTLRGPTTFDLGHANPGSNGQAPLLTIDSTLVGGESLEIDLVAALPNAPAWLIVGLDRLDYFPFLGATLVPSPDLIEPFGTDAQGRLEIATTWPAGLPACTELFFQFWIDDPAAAPFGWAASNGVLTVASGD